MDVAEAAGGLRKALEADRSYLPPEGAVALFNLCQFAVSVPGLIRGIDQWPHCGTNNLEYMHIYCTSKSF